MSEIASILDERGKRYGSFVGHSQLTQDIKSILSGNAGIREGDKAAKNNWEAMDDDQREALEMIAHKLGRIANGDPNYAASWIDIAGYAKLVADRLEAGA